MHCTLLILPNPYFFNNVPTVMAILLATQKLSKSFGTNELFRDITFSIESGERIGLIGHNGSGKTTLLKILVGKTFPDDGKITQIRGLKIGYLAQTPEFQDGATIFSTVTEKISDPNDWEQLSRAHELISKFELSKEGRSENTLISELSGGWKKRAALARELLNNPDLLLLDEPTNHLDIEGILWLEDLISQAPFATLTITHDRVFLQKTSNRILELDKRNPDGLLSIKGDYATYVETKEQLLHALDRREQVLKNTLRRETEWLRRGAKARQTKQQGRIQRAETLKDEVTELKDLNNTRSVKMDFQSADRNPKRLIEAKQISKSYADTVLFKNLDLFIGPKTRLGLLGQNGCGKSTLIRTLIGTEPLNSGTILRADNLKVAYFEQNRESLNSTTSLVKTLCPIGEFVEYQGNRIHIRSYLDRFLFSSNQMDLPIGRLSGGEQSRVLLARLMLQEANVLVLDEPTNDLDLATLNVLEECLTEFNGAVILVTHDRYFLDHVSNQILAFPPAQFLPRTNGQLEKFANVEQWENWHNELFNSRIIENPKATNTPQKKKRLGHKEQRELEGMEKVIFASEERLTALTKELEAQVTNSSRLIELTKEMETLQSSIEKLYARWAELETLKT